MSAVPSSISGPASVGHSIRSNSNRNGAFFNTFFNSRISSKPPLNHLFFRNSSGAKRKSTITPSKPFSPVMEWQDCMAKIEVDVPCSVAYNCYGDREAIPRWMPFISSVKVLEDKPDLSRWSLKYEAFGRNLEFSWLARNMQPIPNQKIHWRSLEGLPNKGATRFYPKGPSSCLIELTVSYEVPQILTPVASVSILNLLQKLLGCTETGMDSMACGIFGILLCGHFGFRFHGLFGTVLDRGEWECTDLQKNHGSNLPSSCVNPQVWILPGTFPSKIFLRRTSDLLISMEILPHKHAYALIPWNIEDPSACKFSSCIK